MVGFWIYILQTETTKSACRLEGKYKRKESRRTSRILAQASEKLELPSTEIVYREDEEFSFGYVKFGLSLNTQVKLFRVEE